MRLRFLIVSVVVLLLCAGTGYSQTFMGTVDGYWSYNTNTPNVPAGSANRFNNYRAFDIRDQSFSLNYGEIAVEYKPMNVGVRVDFGFGDAADIVHAAEPAGQDLWRHIQQAYVSATKDKLTLDFGKFVTPLGAEVIETKDNWNYTRGLLFTWAIPFYHMGAKATYVASDRATIAGYVVNGWNNVRDTNTDKSVGLLGSFKPTERLALTANYLFGKENPATDDTRQVFDGVATYTISPDRVSLMANYDYGFDRDFSGDRVIWQGIAAYGKAKLSDALTVAGRYEFFDDRNGFTTGITQELQSFTATAQVPWAGFTLWGEYRRDWSNFDTFNKTEDGVQSLVDNQNTFTIGLTYGFTREVK
jgi:hypothetical protein